MNIRKWMFFILFCFGLTACTLPARFENSVSFSPPLQAWIDAPLDKSKIPLQPYKLIFHGTGVTGVDEFEVQINGGVVATVPVIPSSSAGVENGTLYLGEYLWTPPAPGIYLISVQAKSQEQFSAAARVQVEVDGEVDEVESTPTATLEPTLTLTPTVEEQEECTYTALVSIFCRLSPDLDYVAIDAFAPGQSAPVIGQSAEGFHWYVLGPNNSQACTVTKSEQYGTTTGDCDEKPRFTPVPKTLTPTSPPSGCTVISLDGAINCVSPCPSGAEPGEACTP